MSNHYDEPLKAIGSRARTVGELLDKAKYATDFYQSDYAWQERQVRELIDDLTRKFLFSLPRSGVGAGVDAPASRFTLGRWSGWIALPR